MQDNKSSLVVQSTSPLSFDLGDRVCKVDPSMSVVQMATEDAYRSDKLDHGDISLSALTRKSDEERQYDTAIIYHSSGSTGFPKGIPTSHVKLLARIQPGKGRRAMCPAPLFHAYCGKITINSIMAGQCMYLSNPMVPQTSESLLEMCREAKPFTLWAGECKDLQC